MWLGYAYAPFMPRESANVSPRPLRRDAVDNRRRLLGAAAEAFAEHGLALDVRDIARRAGVGIGTVYRHFATKELLADAVVAEVLDRWAATVREASGAADAWQGLAQFMERSLELVAQHRALLDGLADPMVATPRFQQCQDELQPVLAGMIDRARDAGVLRPEITLEDVSLLLIGLGRIIQLTEARSPGHWRRQLRVVLAGLRLPE